MTCSGLTASSQIRPLGYSPVLVAGEGVVMQEANMAIFCTVDQHGVKPPHRFSEVHHKNRIFGA
jgi:hypothetical protein